MEMGRLKMLRFHFFPYIDCLSWIAKSVDFQLQRRDHLQFSSVIAK